MWFFFISISAGVDVCSFFKQLTIFDYVIFKFRISTSFNRATTKEIEIRIRISKHHQINVKSTVLAIKPHYEVLNRNLKE